MPFDIEIRSAPAIVLPLTSSGMVIFFDKVRY
jgi:hypothetical protein